LLRVLRKIITTNL